MKRSDRPHVTAFAALSADGRVLPPTAAELGRQTESLALFDSVALDGAPPDPLPPGVTGVWLAASVEMAARHPAPAVFFTRRAPAGPPPPHLRLVREKSDPLLRLARLSREFGVRRFLCPLGSRILPSLLALDLVDELHLSLHPTILAGRKSPTLTGRPGPHLPAATRWHRVRLIQENETCTLLYRRV